MRKPLQIVAIAVLLAGLLTAAVAYGVVKYRRSNSNGGQSLLEHAGFGFTLYEAQSVTIVGQKPWVSMRRVRAVASDGKIKTVTTSYKQDGTLSGSETEYSIPFVGVLGADNERKVLVFMSPKDHQFHNPSLEEAKQSLTYLREDTVLGYPVYVEGVPASPKDPMSIETYSAPALQGQIIKEVYASPKATNAVEVTRIDFREPDASEFVLPDYPIDYTGWETKIAKLREKGDARAKELEKTLRRYQAANAKLRPAFVPVAAGK
jgi:hypothetical protein